MKFIRLTKELNILTKPLYEEVFSNDKGAFSDYYYREIARNNTIYAAVSEDGADCPTDEARPVPGAGTESPQGGLAAVQIQSMVHLNPYTLNWNGEQITIPYIVAVATRKELRHHGLMRSLLEMIFRDLETDGVPFAFLMPVDEAIYRPFGFSRTWSWQWEEDVTAKQEFILADTETIPSSRCADETLQQLADYVNDTLAGEYELFTERSVAYYRRLEKEQQASGGQLQILMRDGRPVAAVQTAREDYPPMMCRVMNREAYEGRLKGKGDRPFENAFVCEVV